MTRRDKILIVEDQIKWQERIAEMLSNDQWEIYTANNVETALEQVRKIRFQVKVVDICLDEYDEENLEGMQVLQDNTERDEGTVPLVLSGHGTIGISVEAAMNHNIIKFIEKNRIDIVGDRRLIQDCAILARKGIEQVPQDSEIRRLVEKQKLQALPQPMRIGMDFVDKENAVRMSKEILPLERIADGLELYQKGKQGWRTKKDESLRQLQGLFITLLPKLGPSLFDLGNMKFSQIETHDPTVEILFWSREYGQAVSVIVTRAKAYGELPENMQKDMVIEVEEVGDLQGIVQMIPDIHFDEFQ